MKCPFCAYLESKVTDSRVTTAADAIRRRRECERCGQRFTTYEYVEQLLPLIVKKDGRRESFEPQKVMRGLRKACDKRAIALHQLETVVEQVKRALVDAGEKEVSSQLVGEKVMSHLRQIDEIAYVRFASVYRSFRDIDELMSELKSIRDEGRSHDLPASSVSSARWKVPPKPTPFRALGSKPIRPSRPPKTVRAPKGSAL